jgi:small subunit ribosomal protein S20
MANIKSAKKQARQAAVKQQINLARKTAVKTAVKKVLTALAANSDASKIKELLKDAESKISRARGKHLLHGNTAARKIGRLAHKVAQATKK